VGKRVGHAEARPTQDFFLAVGGVGKSAAKKGPELLLVTHGTLNEIAEDFRDTKGLMGFFTVNISDIIRRLHAKARAIGIDLSRPFFFPPNDARFDEILLQVKRERDARIARFRRNKKKFAATTRRIRNQDITAAPRVRSISYPIEMPEVA
jgi:hypothetical protein